MRFVQMAMVVAIAASSTQGFAANRWVIAQYFCGNTDVQHECQSIVDGTFDPATEIGHSYPWIGYGLDGANGRLFVETPREANMAVLEGARAGAHSITQPTWFYPNKSVRYSAWIKTSPGVRGRLTVKSLGGSTAIDRTVEFSNMRSDYFKVVQLGFLTPNEAQPGVDIAIAFDTPDDQPAWVRVAHVKLEYFEHD